MNREGLLRTWFENLLQLRAVTLPPVHASQMARMLFQTYLAAGVVCMAVISPFFAANPPGTLIVGSTLALAAWLGDRMAARGRPVLAMHCFCVVIALLATVPGIILGRNVAIAAVIIFTFVPAYAAIAGLWPAVVYVMGMVVVSLGYAQLIELGLALPVLFPMPPTAQLSVITVCAFIIILPMPALFRSMNEERQRADQELAARKRQEAVIREAHAAAEVANEAKSTFLANMSHEIRTPLNAIIGLTELTLETPLTRTQSAHLQTVVASAHALLRQVNDILDFSKAEAGKVEISREPFSLHGLLAEIEHFFLPQLRGRSLSLTHARAADLPDILLGDRFHLRQVLLNLIGNALKFTESGSVQVTAARTREAASQLQLVIRDTGIGIEAEHLPRLFAPFTQADASITRRYGGTGLGLALSRRLVEAMDGTIEVESRVGEGSTFTIRLPLTVPGSGDAAVSESGAAPAGDGPSLLPAAAGSEAVPALGGTRLLSATEIDRLRALTERLDTLLGSKMLDAKALSLTIAETLHGSELGAVFEPVVEAASRLRFKDAQAALTAFRALPALQAGVS